MDHFHEKAQSSQDAVAAFLCFLATSVVSSFLRKRFSIVGRFFGRLPSAKHSVCSDRSKFCATALAGDAQGGGSPLVGGAGSIDTCQLLLLARSVLPAWGEPARPGLPPEGETGKGALNSLLPLAILFSWYMCPSH